MQFNSKTCIVYPLEGYVHERCNCFAIADEVCIERPTRIETLTTLFIIIFIS